jgi:hypothetical protein
LKKSYVGLRNLPPTYAHHFWNVLDRVEQDLPRTNNMCEGWHNGFSKFVGEQYKNVYGYVNMLKSQQLLNQTKIFQYMAGTPPPAQLGKYKDVTARIKRLTDNYATIERVQFLRGIAQNLKYGT